MTELRYAVRRLASAPGFLLTALATLGLGIGATTLMFTAVHGLLVRPLPFPDADRIGWVMAQPASGELEGLSSTETSAIAARVPAIESIAVIGDMGLVRAVSGRHDRWRGIWTTADLVDVLGVSLRAGQVQPLTGSAGLRSMLVAQERWEREFGSDPALIGRELAFEDNKRFIVVGILPRGLEFPFARAPHRGNGAGFVPGRQDFWVLQPAEATGLPGGFTIAKLGRAASPAEARAQIDSVERGVIAEDPRAMRRTLLFTPLRDQVLGNLAPALPVLLAFAALVFLVACGNLATLLLARAVSQREEVAIRVALGARPAVLARTFVTEAFLLSAAGAALGLLITAAGRMTLARLAPRHDALVERISIDWTTVLFVSTLAVVVTLIFGVVPGWRRARAAVADVSHASSTRTTSPGHQRSFRVLVIAQVALSLALVVGGFGLRDSFHRIMSVEAGYDMRDVVAADMLLFVPMTEAVPIIDRVVTTLQNTPGVTAVGLVHSTPLTGKWTFQDSFEVLGTTPAVTTPPISGGFVAYDYFAAMGVPIVAGRSFTRTEFSTSRQRVMIINDIAARRFFPGGDVVGSRIRMNGSVHEIIGVVKGTRDARLDAAPEPQWYQPAMLGSSQIIVRGSGPTAATTELVERVLRESDSRMIVEEVNALETIASESVIERRLAAQLVSAFAITAVVLAGIGLYGVVNFGAMQRQREFGIRLAVGATPMAIVRIIIRQGLSMAAAGIALGVILSLAGADALQSLLFEARAADLSTVSFAAGALILTAALACVRPGWRAASVDPAITLRWRD